MDVTRADTGADAEGASPSPVGLVPSESLFRGLLESAPDAIVIVDARGTIVLVNAQAERLFGYGRAELVGHPLEILVPARAAHRHAAHREGYVAAPRIRGMGSGLELHGRRKDGSEFAVEISLGPIETADGILVASAIRDVTARKEAERVLARARDAAEEANRELEAFSSSVAHDLRAPLRGMNGFAQLLLETYGDRLDDEGRDWLGEIVANARRMGQLIDALLALARVTRTEVRREAVNLSAVARLVSEELRAADPERPVHVEIEPDLVAEADAHLVRVMMTNLLGNAFKFTGGAAAPRIRFGRDPEDPDGFVVADNGAGFDMAYASKLFIPFQRLHTAREFPGTGVGLATVQRIVTRHGGRIRAEGRVGEGARFHFTLGAASAADAR